MSNYTIQAVDLVPGQKAIIKGKLIGNHLYSVLSGAELEAENQRRLSSGARFPYQGKNLTYAHLTEASVAANGQENQQLAQFITERFFISKKDPSRGQCYSMDNPSNRPPEVYQLDGQTPDGSAKYKPVTLTGNLKNGTPVSLYVESYATKSGYRGLGLRAVMIDVQGEVPYYNGGGLDTSTLASMGIVVDTSAAPTQQATIPEAPSVPQAGTDQQFDAGYPAQPAFGGQPSQQQAQAAQQPIQATQQQAQPQQPIQQAQPDFGNGAQPAGGQNGSAFGAQPTDAPQPAPWDQPQNNPGISFSE